MAIQITTKPVRIAFPEIFTPGTDKNSGKSKYSCVLIMEPGSEAAMEIRKALHAAIIEAQPDKAKWPPAFRNMDFKTHASTTGKDGWPIRDGDSVSWDGFAGKEFIKVTSNADGPKSRPPYVVDRNREEILDSKELFGGLIVRARLSCRYYDHRESGSKGVSAYISGLQIIKDDGVRFGSYGNPKDDFDDWHEDTDTSMDF